MSEKKNAKKEAEITPVEDQIKLGDSPDYKTFIVHTTKYKTLLTKKFINRKKYVPVDPKQIKAFIPGTIMKVYVKKGKKVRKGQNLLVLEAMKMNNLVKSPLAGTIKDVYVKEGEVVAKDQLLVEFE